ncbi:hypothetical protein D3C85_333710 [compost metagenome]
MGLEQMVKEFVPEGFKPDEEVDQLAEQIRLLEASCKPTPKPMQSGPVREFAYAPQAAAKLISRNARIHLDDDEGARKLNGGVRAKPQRRS